MASVLSEPGRPRPLAELLTPGEAWPLGLALPFMHRLAEQVLDLHAAGELHGAIDVATIQVDRQGAPTLPPPPSTVKIGGEWFDLQFCPPELADADSVVLPRQLATAAERLAAAGRTLNARRIDVYQLGAVLCRLLTGEPVQAYLYGPSVKAGVSPSASSLLDRALGYDGDERFADCESFITALSQSENTLAGEAGSKARSSDSTLAPPEEAAAPAVAPAEIALTAVRDSHPATEAASLPLTQLGACRILSQLGRGGMGDVYKAHDESLDRLVAIKVLPPQLARDREFVRRFHAEAAAIARLIHPHVVQVHSIGEDQGHHYFVMQFVDGDSLAQRLQRHRRLDVDEALAIFEQCLTGLGAAHDEGLIHRDIKPGNILLDARSGRALLADFGLVKQVGKGDNFTATGMILGTVDYLSPEQGRGLPVDARSDLYSMGVLLYEMLSGRLPFRSESPTAMVFQHAYERPRPLAEVVAGVPEDLQAIVARLLRKDPADRYQTARDLLDDVRAFRQGRPLPLSDRRRWPSEIRRVPDFGGEPAAAALPLPSEYGLWQRLQDRAQSLVRRRTPEFVKQLQTTTQQVDGALAEYTRRREKLARLLNEGRVVLADLSAQIDEELTAAAAAMPSVDDAEDQSFSAASGAGPGLQRLADLRSQREQQQQAIADMEILVAQVDARLAQLTIQRDLFHARLKAVDAQRLLAGRRPSRHITGRNVLIVAGAAAIGLGFWALQGRSHSGAPQTVEERPPAPAQSAMPSEMRHGQLPPQVKFVTSSGDDYRFFVDDTARLTEYRISGDGRITRGDSLELQDRPDAVALSADGIQVATAANDAVIEIWDFAAKKVVHRLVGHTQPVVALAFSAEGERLVSASGDATLRLWEVATETELTSATCPVSIWESFKIAWSPDGSQIAVTSAGVANQGPGFTIYDGNSLNMLRRVVAPQSRRPPTCLAYAVGGTQIVTLVDDNLKVWDAETGREVRSLPSRFREIAVAPGGRRLMALDQDGAEIWETSSDTIVARLPGVYGGVSKIDISYDGAWAAGLDYRGATYAWRLPDTTPPGQLQLFSMGLPVRCAAFSPDGFLAGWSVDRQIDVWDIQRPRKDLITFEQPIRTSALTFSADARRLAYATGQPNRVNSEVRVKEIAGFGPGQFPTGFQESRWVSGFSDIATGLAWLPGGKRLVVCGRDGTLRVTEMGRDDSSQRIDLKIPLNAMALSPDGKFVIVGGDDHAARLLDLDAMSETRRFDGHTHFVYTVAFSADGTRVASGGDDRTVRVWNAESAEPVATLTGHTGKVNAVAFLPKGREVISGSDDATICLWDVASSSERLRVAAHAGPVRALAVSWDGGRLLSASDDGTVRLWDLRALTQQAAAGESKK